jgi:hypothetical protein
VLLAPYVILDNIPRWVHPVEYAAGTDRAQLEQWGDRWELYRAWTQPAGPTWRALCIDARYAVVSWAYDVGRQSTLDRLVDALLESGILGGATWRSLVREHTPAWLRKKDREYYAALL